MKRLVLLACVACGPAWAGGEQVSFPHQGLELSGRLYVPPGKGPFPAIVLLHGCNGMWARDGEPNRTYESWAKHFQGLGYMALLLDSFGPRGEKEICTQGKRKILPGRERTADAHASLRWLAGRGDVLPSSIHLLGWSNGGAAVLEAVRPEKNAESDALAFRSAVAFYPACRELVDRYRTRTPLLVQAGSADDWTPARSCEAMVAVAKGRGDPVEIDVYDGAHHAFDAVEGRVRFRADVRNPSSSSGWGAHLGPDPAAREKSRHRATEFIGSHR